MNEIEKKDQMMRAYWLGALSDEQTESFESDWFGNDDDTELLEMARADLIDDYLSASLSASERNRFEKNFLFNNAEDVALAKLSLQLSREKLSQRGRFGWIGGWIGEIRKLGKIPQIAAAAVLLLICFGLFYVMIFDRNSSGDLTKVSEPQANFDTNITADETITANSDNKNTTAANLAPKNNPDSQNKNSDIKPNKEPIENRRTEENKKVTRENPAKINRQVVFLSVFRGEVKQVSLTNPKDFLTLKIVMPGIDKAYKNYEFRILDANNNLVVKQNLGNSLTTKKSGEIIAVPPLKGSILQKNNVYKTTLVGIDEKGKATELSNYDSFRIN